MEQDWRYVPNFPEYIVSNTGHVQRAGSGPGRPLTLFQDPNKGDAVYVHLYVDSKQFTFRLDRIVAAAFLETEMALLSYSSVVHLDGNPANCRVDNLRWDNHYDD